MLQTHDGPRAPDYRLESPTGVRGRSHGPPGLSRGRPDLRDPGLSWERLGHGEAHTRAAGALRANSAGDVRAGEGRLGSRWCTERSIADGTAGRRPRSPDHHVAQPGPATSRRTTGADGSPTRG